MGACHSRRSRILVRVFSQPQKRQTQRHHSRSNLTSLEGGHRVLNESGTPVNLSCPYSNNLKSLKSRQNQIPDYPPREIPGSTSKWTHPCTVANLGMHGHWKDYCLTCHFHGSAHKILARDRCPSQEETIMTTKTNFPKASPIIKSGIIFHQSNPCLLPDCWDGENWNPYCGRCQFHGWAHGTYPRKRIPGSPSTWLVPCAELKKIIQAPWTEFCSHCHFHSSEHGVYLDKNY